MSQQAATGRAAWVRQTLLAVLLGALPLLLGQQVPTAISQNLGSQDELTNATGLNAQAEQSPEGAFRWGGARVGLALQPLGYPLEATLHVSGSRPAEAAPARLQATGGGVDLGVQELPRASTDVTYQLPGAALWAINPQLVLTATTFQPPSDRRTLGVVFYRLDTRSGPGPAVPAPWPAAVLLLSGALAAAAGRAVTRRERAALVVAAAWGLGLGLLNAVARPWLVFYCLDVALVPLLVLLLVPWGRGIAARRAAARLSWPGATPRAVPELEVTTRPWPVAIVVTSAALAVLAWHLVGPSVPSGRGPTDNWTWGVAFYGGLPWPVQLGGVALVLAALAWALLSPLPGRAEHQLQAPAARSGWASLLAVVAGGLSLFSMLPVKYAEGDSIEFDRKIIPGEVWRERELMDFYLKAKLWQWQRPLNWWPLPSQLYAALDTLAGGVYLGGAWLLGRALGRNRRETWVLVGGLAALGNILLFFGYVESYSLVAVASIFVLWACWQYTQGRLGFGGVGALATIAPMFHGSAIWWGPMVLAAWLIRAARMPAASRWRMALAEGAEGVAVGLACVLVLVAVVIIDHYTVTRLEYGLAALGGGDGHTMMHLLTTETGAEHYPFLSWANLGAIVQEQLLTAPLALLTIGSVVGFAWPGVRRLGRA
ncbi:MAG TPA: hypothetical protein VM536_14015, partial [Chloroflexia bacterium]|nr:hypothetical protein [Chloroflexia bacterium]